MNIKKIKKTVEKFVKYRILKKINPERKKEFSFTVERQPTTLENRDKLKISIIDIPEYDFDGIIVKDKIKVEFTSTMRGLFSEWVGPDRSMLRLVVGTKNDYRHPPTTATFYCDKSFYNLIKKTLNEFAKEKWGFELGEK
jgi:hypothetical protein